MESGTRKKRTLAERRESDKLRQRRFRAKKREEARLLQVISGSGTDDRKERVYTVPRKTAEEIRETNRIRQQRFRAKKRGTDDSNDEPLMEAVETIDTEEPVPCEAPTVQTAQDNPVEIIQQILLQAINEEKDRQTELRREKDRIRKRRERQRKRESEMQKVGITPDEFQCKLNQLEMDMSQAGEQEEDMTNMDELDESGCQDIEPTESPETLIKQETEDGEVEIGSSLVVNGFFDSTQFMSQLEQMSLLMKLASAVDTTNPALKGKSISPDVSATLEELGASSSSPLLPQIADEIPTTEKKPWQRCSSSEERRERERMRKRMYRAKQKFISTGKLEMQWDPTPIKRTPNDDGELGITPIPEWTKNLSSEQKLAAHRIYNKRYRERIKNCTGSVEREHNRQHDSHEKSETTGGDNDFSNLPPEVYNEILATISQCDLSSLMGVNQTD